MEASLIALLAGIAGLAVIAATLWCHDDWLDGEHGIGEPAPSKARGRSRR
jgi:hypothetical protein